MIKNYPTLKKIALIIFLLFSHAAFSQTPDFKVQHIQDDVARAGGTNTTFTAVSSLNNAIELANNNRKTHAGQSDSNNGDLEGDDLSGARVLTAPGTLTYYREGASVNSNMRFNTSIWEYMGSAGGNNEMIVRGRYTVTLNGTTNSVTQAISGIVNANKCIPFITGIMNNSGSDDADSGTAIAYLENATTLRVQKGSNANNVTVYITLVEFTGGNWTVLHGDSGNIGGDTGTMTLRNGSDGTGTATNVSSWSDAIIFSHFRADNNANGANDAIADLWPVTDPGGNLQTVDWRFHSEHDSNGTNRHFVHVLANTGLNVTRYQNTSNVDNEYSFNISTAGLTDVNQSLIVGSSTSSGTGTAYGRGWRNYYLKSVTQAAHWAHRSGNTMAHEIQIIDLTGLTSPCNISNNTFDFTTGNYGTTSTTVTENANAILTAPAGKYFMYVGFASYGTPTGTAPNFAIGGCDAATSQSVTEGYLIGNNSATIPATNAVFGDPCVGTVKSLYVQASYATPICSGTSPGLITGTTPTGGTGTFTYLWESSTTSATAGFGNATGTNNAINYTPPALTQTTWYRRTVYSGSCSNVSAVIQISINTINTWNGSVSSDWNTSGNWCSGVPNLITNNIDVLIPSGLLTNYPVISAGDAAGEVVNIVFENNTTLNIIDNSLRVTGNLTLNGKIDLEGESQLLQDTGSVLDAASTGTIEIDQQGEGNKYRYNYWSMPVYTGYDAVELKNYTTIFASLRDGTNPSNPGIITFNNSGYDGALTTPITLSSYWMYKFTNSGSGYSAWSQIRSTGKLYTGQGFTMKGPGDPGSPAQNYVFVGKPNNGTIELDVNAGNEYLVGNPYPSAIDANQFLNDNGPSGTNIIGIGAALQFWEHFGGDTHNLAGYQAGYATYNLAGGVSASANPPVAGISTLGTSLKGKPGRYIPVGQAFFVVGNITGKIQFNNGQRIFVKESQLDVNGDPFSVFMKSNNTKAKTVTTSLADLRPKFRIGFDAPKISHRQLLLTIDERATQEVDWGFDAEIYEIFTDDFYWTLNNKKYVIQGTNEVGLNSEVPLGIQLSKTGMVTIKIDALENVDDDIAIYLKDKLTGESFNMRGKPVELNLTAGKYADRFVITFKTQKLVAEDVVAEVLIPATAQPIIEGIHVYMNNAIGELQINNNSTEEIVSVELFNYLGQRVNYWNTNLKGRTISLPISSVTGVYLVQIYTEKGATNKKIVVI